MRTTELSELAAFDAVARHRSFRRAAAERGVTASAISHAISGLEARVGVRLLNRTTRSVSPTDAGAMLLARLGSAFSEIGTALDALNKFRDTPYGKVRLNVPNSVPFLVGPVIGPLLAKNPNLELEIIATDRPVDIVAEGFDAGLRLGENLREGMTAVKIRKRLRFAVVGSPDYFKSHAMPRTPADLDRHVCIRNLYPNGTPYDWDFRHGDKSASFTPRGPLALDDHELMLEAALAGTALAYVWEERATRLVRDKRLVQCLRAWCEPEDWVYVYYPSRRYVSAGLRALIEALRV